MKCDETCFAAAEEHGSYYCKATTYRKCQGTKCPFYKTEEQYHADRSKAEEINRLRGIKCYSK